MKSKKPEFLALLKESQLKKEFVIDEITYKRIPCGYEKGSFGQYMLDTDHSDSDDTEATCMKCEAPTGYFHLLGCSMEQCPMCHGQAFCCECEYEDSEGWRTPV